MSVFSDRRSLRQIGGLSAYVRQVVWSIRWRLRRRRGFTVLGAQPALTATRASRPARYDRHGRPAA